MRIGFDVDGVLADFIPAYQRLVVEVAGEDKFLPGDDRDPPCWNWPEARGYDSGTVAAVWQRIITSRNFWSRLEPLDGAGTLAMVMPHLKRHHDIYFVTARPGLDAKKQTEGWLALYVGGMPTVLISKHKGAVAAVLGLDAYIDDNLENCLGVAAQSPGTRCYLLDRRYNQDPMLCLPKSIIRVDSVGQMLDYETLHHAL